MNTITGTSRSKVERLREVGGGGRERGGGRGQLRKREAEGEEVGRWETDIQTDRQAGQTDKQAQTERGRSKERREKT